VGFLPIHLKDISFIGSFHGIFFLTHVVLSESFVSETVF